MAPAQEAEGQAALKHCRQGHARQFWVQVQFSGAAHVHQISVAVQHCWQGSAAHVDRRLHIEVLKTHFNAGKFNADPAAQGTQRSLSNFTRQTKWVHQHASASIMAQAHAWSQTATERGAMCI